MLSEMRQMGEGCDKNALNEREKCVASVNTAFYKISTVPPEFRLKGSVRNQASLVLTEVFVFTGF